MDDLLAEFLAETREMLEACESALIAWEADPADHTQLDAVFRFVHTVKGNCGFFDFPRLEKLSHAAEDALAEVRSGRRKADSDLVSAVLAIIDRIAAFANAIEADDTLPDDDDETLIAALDPASSTGSESITAGETAASANAPKPAPSRSIRLPTDLLDQVMSGVSDMVLARNDLAHHLRSSASDAAVNAPFERLTSIMSEVREAVTKMRMQRIDLLYSGFPRLVRDLSAELGKQVMLDLDGGDVELDREMIEMVRDPITHILRNAIDHGIEKPADRIKAGKHEIGTIAISARQSGNVISLRISDDGAGLDPGTIESQAVAANIVTKEELADMSAEERLQLVFAPGLSTAKKVTSVSGRGVGLDVVRDNLQRIGGSIHITSVPGKGAIFHLALPLTLSIIAGLTVDVAGQRFAIAQSSVEEIVRMDSRSLEAALLGDRSIVTFRGERIPCLSLAEALGLESSVPADQQTLVMTRLASGAIFALIVDQIHAITDLVVKPLPRLIMDAQVFNGSTLLDDGTAILVLDLPQLAQNGGLLTDGVSFTPPVTLAAEAQEAQKPGIRVLVFESFDGRMSGVRLPLVTRIETIKWADVDRSGKQDRAVVNGEIIPVTGLSKSTPSEDTRLRMLRLSDGTTELCLGVAAVHEAAEIASELADSDDEKHIEGFGLLDGKTLALVNGHEILEKMGRPCPEFKDEAA